MSQQDFDIATGDANTGITFRAAVNAALQALASISSGTAAPSIAYPFQIYINTTDSPAGAYIRNAANTAWVKFGYVDAGTGKLMLFNADTATNATNATNVDTVDSYHAAGLLARTAHTGTQDGSTVVGGILGATVVPLARMMRTEVSGIGTTLDLGTVNAGDRILIYYTAQNTSAGAGFIDHYINHSSGTATWAVGGNDTVLRGPTLYATGVGQTHHLVKNGVIRVTGSGNLILASNVSNSNGIGSHQWHAIVLNNG